MRTETKAQRERRFFEWFATAARLQVIGEIQQPDPPDIIAEIAGQGRTAFELVCVDAKSEFFRHELFRKTESMIKRGLAALPLERRAALERKYADAEINVALPSGVPLREISVDSVWAILEKLPPDFVEQVSCPRDIAEFLWVYRKEGHAGPTVSALSHSSIPPVRLEPIERKLAKAYASNIPLELVAYTEHCDILHRSDNEAVSAIAGAKLASSSFRRLWLFDGWLRKIELKVERVGVGDQGSEDKL